MFLTSELTTCFIGTFTFGMKSQFIVSLLSGSAHIYVGLWTLKVKCTQYGICGYTTFKNARAMVSFEVGGVGTGQKFSIGSKKISIYFWGLPLLVCTSPEKLVGKGLTSPQNVKVIRGVE